MDGNLFDMRTDENRYHAKVFFIKKNTSVMSQGSDISSLMFSVHVNDMPDGPSSYMDMSAMTLRS